MAPKVHLWLRLARFLALSGLTATWVMALAHAAIAQEQTDLAYGTGEQQNLNICRPTTQAAGAALLLIHGGGWRTGNKRDTTNLCRIAANRGILGVSVGYRLAAGTPNTIWPAQFDDVAAAVGWLRSHADTLRIDPGRICAFGASSGGQLAAMLAVRHEVACAIDAFGPVDLTTYHSPVPFLFGPSAEDKTARYQMEREASPTFLVDRTTPPIMIIQGLRDRVVPPSQSLEFAKALRDIGADPVLITYDGDHSFKGISSEERQDILARAMDFVLRTTNAQNPPKQNTPR